MGLRFLYIDKNSGVALRSWLSLLEAQCRLREQSEPSFTGSVQESEQVIDWRGFPKGEDFRTL
jgi:hypothetical protein